MEGIMLFRAKTDEQGRKPCQASPGTPYRHDAIIVLSWNFQTISTLSGP